jgi:hypothetical protein
MLFQRQNRNNARQAKSLPCHTCYERIPTFVSECGHRICGECIPTLIHDHHEVVDCKLCVVKQPMSVEMLGRFVDALSDES